MATLGLRAPLNNASADNAPEALVVQSCLTAVRRRLIGAGDLIIERTPHLTWRRADLSSYLGGLMSWEMPSIASSVADVVG